MIPCKNIGVASIVFMNAKTITAPAMIDPEKVMALDEIPLANGTMADATICVDPPPPPPCGGQ